MDLNIMTAGAIGLALLTAADGGSDAFAAVAYGPADYVGDRLYASDSPIARYGEALRAEDLSLDDLGTVTAVIVGADGQPQSLVVSVGGLWGFGAREVDVSMEGVHVVGGEGGAARLVVDLSA